MKYELKTEKQWSTIQKYKIIKQNVYSCRKSIVLQNSVTEELLLKNFDTMYTLSCIVQHAIKEAQLHFMAVSDQIFA